MPLLDHIVVLVPYSFVESPPAWFSELFVSYPGGRHADGVTENTLVLLSDGSYIEFIAFVPGADPRGREGHRWGREEEGSVIDWALTLPGGEGLDEKARAFDKLRGLVRDTHTGIEYGDLIPGGRHRPDGRLLRWAVAGAYEGRAGELERLEPGKLPFWCLDDTERDLRVPYLQDGVARHPAGVVGVAAVSVSPGAPDDTGGLGMVYDVLLGRDERGDGSGWRVGTPAGNGLHPGGRVLLKPDGGARSVSITLFTSSPEFVGRTGGDVGSGVRLEFELVAT